MSFYFPKDNILFTDGLTIPSKQEEFIRQNNNPTIKDYKALATLIHVNDIIEFANKTYLIDNNVHTTSTIVGTPYALAKMINMKHPEALSRKSLKSESRYFTKKLKPQDSKKENIINQKTAKYNINGMTFHTLPEIANYFNINVEQLRLRIYKQNMSIQDAINHKPKKVKQKKKNRNIITKDGEIFSSVYEISKKYDLAQVTIERLLKNNKSIKHYNRPKSEFIINGVSYKSLTSYCNDHNLNINTVYSRIKRGQTLEEAVNQKIKKQSPIVKNITKKPINKRPLITINGKSYSNIKAACKDYNIKYNTYRTRRKKGWSVEEAITTPLMKCNST